MKEEHDYSIPNSFDQSDSCSYHTTMGKSIAEKIVDKASTNGVEINACDLAKYLKLYLNCIKFINKEHIENFQKNKYEFLSKIGYKQKNVFYFDNPVSGCLGTSIIRLICEKFDAEEWSEDELQEMADEILNYVYRDIDKSTKRFYDLHPKNAWFISLEDVLILPSINGYWDKNNV